MKCILIWDFLVRIFHWSLAACFLIAYALEDKMLNLHVLTGSIALGLVIFRLIWGILGTEHSRFANFPCSFRQVKQHLHDLVYLRPAHYIGHTPAGSMMIFLLLAGLMVLTLSGVMLYGLENTSLPFASLMDGINLDMILRIENLHGFMANLLALFVLYHVAGVLVESHLQKQNLIRAMITGYKTYRKEKI